MARPPIRLELEKDDVLLVVSNASEKADDHLEAIRRLDDTMAEPFGVPCAECATRMVVLTDEDLERLRDARDRHILKFDRCQALIATVEEQTL